jgi:hypothetical protein
VPKQPNRTTGKVLAGGISEEEARQVFSTLVEISQKPEASISR